MDNRTKKVMGGQQEQGEISANNSQPQNYTTDYKASKNKGFGNEQQQIKEDELLFYAAMSNAENDNEGNTHLVKDGNKVTELEAQHYMSSTSLV